MIKDPIDLGVIKQRTAANQYTTFELFEADFTRMCVNAKKYNIPKTPIYKDAARLLRILTQVRAALVAAVPAPGQALPSSQLLKDLVTDVFSAAPRKRKEEKVENEEKVDQVPRKRVKGSDERDLPEGSGVGQAQSTLHAEAQQLQAVLQELALSGAITPGPGYEGVR